MPDASDSDLEEDKEAENKMEEEPKNDAKVKQDDNDDKDSMGSLDLPEISDDEKWIK